MKRFGIAFSALALMTAASGCCCHHFGGGGCAPPPACNPCGPYGANIGTYPAYSQAYVTPAYTTAAVSNTGFVTASTAACDCAPAVNPY